MGGSGIIDGVIAYDTALYKKIHGDASISTFEMSFIDALKEYKNNFYDIFEYRGIEPKGVTACVISLSIESHNKYFEKTVTVDFGVYDYVLIKKHPGFTSQTLTEIKNAVYVDTSLPLEFIVLELIEKDFIIDFYHDCSSLLLYMKKYFRTCVNYAPDTVFKSNYEKVNNLLS